MTAAVRLENNLPATVLSRNGKLVGQTTGKSHPCTLEGCRGLRIMVKWPGGKTTRPCSNGMDFSADGKTARIV